MIENWLYDIESCSKIKVFLYFTKKINIFWEKPQKYYISALVAYVQFM